MSKKMNKLDCGRVDLTGWNANFIDKVQQLMLDGVQEVLNTAMEYEGYLAPCCWLTFTGEKAEVRFELSLNCDTEDENPQWTKSLEDLTVGGLSEGDDMLLEDGPRLRDQLRALADRIDKMGEERYPEDWRK